MYKWSCFSEQSRKQTSSSNTFSQWNSRQCASQQFLFIIFREHALLPGQPYWLICMSLLCCWCLLSVHAAVHKQSSIICFLSISQYSFSAHHIQDCRPVLHVPEFLGDVFHYFIFLFHGGTRFLTTVLNEWQLLDLLPSVGLCISASCNNSYRRGRRKDKFGLDSDNCLNNIMLGCIVI